MVQGSHLLARDKFIELGVDNLLEGDLRTGIVVLADESLALQSVSKLLGHLDGALLVADASLGGQVRNGLVALVGNPLQNICLGGGVLRLGVAVKVRLYDRSGTPAKGEEQLGLGAQDAGLSHAALLDLRVSQFSVEVIDHVVGTLDDHIVALIGTSDQRVVVVHTERLNLVTRGTVSLIGTGNIDLVSSILPHGEERAVIPTSGSPHRVGEETAGSIVSSHERGLGIVIGLVERTEIDDTLARDIQSAFATHEHQGSCCNNQGDKYLFHFRSHLRIRTRG